MNLSAQLQTKEQSSKLNDNYIIVDENDCYWSEEEGGRFSRGALYEKTFATRVDGERYAESKCISGKVIRHSTHWTGGMPFIYDSSKYNLRN